MKNLDLMRKRLIWQGGVAQEDRMIHDKYRTLERVLLYSYQACTVQKVQPRRSLLPYLEEEHRFDDRVEERFPQVRALINPDKLKQDYDDKILSIPYEDGFEPGDVFEWNKTGSFWLVYNSALTEDAYYRGEIRRCRFKINFKDKDGVWRSTWAAIRGPVETDIDSIQKNQIREDRPNLSLDILLPLNEWTHDIFKRYTEFLFGGHCWRVEAYNDIKIDGVISVNAQEYYIDKDTDNIDELMKNGLLINPAAYVEGESGIEGESFIMPKIAERYTTDVPGTWSYEGDKCVKITPIDALTVEVVWDKMTSGQFVLQWTNGNEQREKPIIVESLL